MASPPPRVALPGRTAVLLAAVSAAVTAARVLQLESLPDRGVFAKYPVFAQQLLSGDALVDRLPDLSLGYLWFVALLQGPLGLGTEGIVRLQLVLVGVSAAAVGLLGCRLAGRTAGWFSLAILLTSKGAWLNATEIEPETVALALGTAALTVLLWSASGPVASGVAGLLLGVSAIVRPTVLPAALALAAWRCWGYRRRGSTSAARAVLAAALLLAGTLIPPALTRLAGSPAVRTGVTMNPGTVFYEGWNPMATGYLGEAPAVVKAVERAVDQPDALHVAYRRVAATAGAADANRFWSGIGFASVLELPGRAVALAADKAWFALHSHEAWDLLTVWRRDRLVARGGWLPFGIVAALALVAGLLTRSHPATFALLAWSSGYLAVMVAFYVTSRQRNPLLPAAALLAGLGVDALLRLWREGRRRRLAIAAGAVVAVALPLVAPWHPQREDRHAWTATAEAKAASRLAAAAPDPRRASELWAEAALRLAPVPPEVPHAAIRSAVARRLAAGASPAARFDAAVAASRVGDWATAERVLEGLDQIGYRARRGFEVSGSVAYHRARCHLALGDPEGARELVAQALREVPGDPWATALAIELGPRPGWEEPELRNHRRRLARLHDPLTADLARARALADVGSRDRAAALVETLRSRLPEWETPLREARTW